MSLLQTKLLVGHVLDRLRELPDTSVHCCVTSPPYWGLRDYGTEPQIWDGDPACQHIWGRNVGRNDTSTMYGQGSGPVKNKTETAFCSLCNAWSGSLGLEPTPDLYVQHLIAIFREVRRVLRDDGTLFLNLGDSYASGVGTGEQGKRGQRFDRTHTQEYLGVNRKFPELGLKPKDLIGIPWMAAFALRADGWYLRSEIIWAKTAPMPESVTDRPTCAHEAIFLFSKSQRYFYDNEAVKEPSRNQRNVWTLNPAPFVGAHFATFPPEIPRRAISAGTSEKGVCATCGAPWKRLVDRQSTAGERGATPFDYRALGVPQRGNVHTTTTTLGWEPTCKHTGEPIPATVIDPFFGSGTTGLVAQQLWRSCIGIDLSDKYAQIGKDRMPDGLLYQMDIA